MATVQKWGNSLGIRIPVSAARQINLNDGSQVTITVHGNELKIKRVEEEPSLKEMLSNVTSDNRHESIDLQPIGREII